MIEALLNLYKPKYITNIAQLKRINIDDTPLFSALAQQGGQKDSLEEMSKKTLYKLILSDDNNVFPYINIFNDEFENTFSSTQYKNNSRDKIKEHLQALLKDATNVFIYDKYFKDNWERTKEFFQLAPKKNLTFFYKENHFDQQMITEAKRICNQWKFKQDTATSTHTYLHDRYLRIDSKLEIIFTSGFDNLFDTSTDLTYIVRKL